MTSAVPTEELEKKSNEIIVRANGLAAITSTEQYQDAGEIAKMLRGFKKGVTEFWAPLKQNAHKAWKDICNRENLMLEPVDQAIASVDGKITTYAIEQERIRQQKEAEAREILRKEEEERALREAAVLEQSGDHEGAERVVNEAVLAPQQAVVMPSTVPQVKGVSLRKSWKWRLRDAKAINREYLMTDDVKINRIVTALGKSAEAAVGGIEVYEVSGVSARS